MNDNLDFESYASQVNGEESTIPVSPNGVYDHPYQNVIVPTQGNITMKNVDYPILGISMETGQRQMMLPGDNYNFENTQNVLEIPQFQNGGKITYDPVNDIYGTFEIDEILLKGKKPSWSKHKEQYIKNNPKEQFIQNYLDAYPWAGQSLQNYPKRLDSDYDNLVADYIGEKIVEDKPMGNQSRENWLNSLSKSEQSYIQRNPKYQTSLWQDTVEGGKSLFNLGNSLQVQRINDSDNYTELEKQQLIQQHKNNPILSNIGDVAQILSPLTIPSKIVQSGLRNEYSVGDALRGTKNRASMTEDILTDPLNWLGFSKIDDIVKGLGKINNTGKIRNSNRVLELEEGINSLKKPDWLAWNKEIPENVKLLDEYKNIETQSKSNGTWMKNSDGSLYKGKPEQFIQEKSTNFKNAFGNSLVKEKQYHTTDASFNEFDPSRSPSKGIYFTNNKEYAEKFPNIYRPETASNYKTGEYYLSANKGFYIPESVNHGTIDHYVSQPFFKKSNIDLLRGKETTPFGLRGKEDVNVVFNPTQIKSAMGNNGMFDLKNPNIYKSLAIPLGVGAYLESDNNVEKYQNGGQIVRGQEIKPVELKNIGKYTIGLDNVDNTMPLEDYEIPNTSRIKNFEEYVLNEYREWET